MPEDLRLMGMLAFEDAHWQARVMGDSSHWAWVLNTHGLN